MLGQYGVAIGAFILMRVIEYFATSIGVGGLDLRSRAGYLMYIGVNIIISLIASVLVFGEMGIYLKIACNVQASIGDLFSGFSIHPDKPIIIRLIFMAMSCGCYLVPAVLFAVYMSSDRAGIFTLACFLAILGTVVLIYLKLSFALVYYLVLDYPRMNVKEAFGRSQALMYGHRFSLMYMYVSFIPLYMLSLLTLGIGNLFITPYRKMTMTEFYLDLAHNESVSAEKHEDSNDIDNSNADDSNSEETE